MASSGQLLRCCLTEIHKGDKLYIRLGFLVSVNPTQAYLNFPLRSEWRKGVSNRLWKLSNKMVMIEAVVCWWESLIEVWTQFTNRIHATGERSWESTQEMKRSCRRAHYLMLDRLDDNMIAILSWHALEANKRDACFLQGADNIKLRTLCRFDQYAC
jgi:hypothetical protein